MQWYIIDDDATDIINGWDDIFGERWSLVLSSIETWIIKLYKSEEKRWTNHINILIFNINLGFYQISMFSSTTKDGKK